MAKLAIMLSKYEAEEIHELLASAVKVVADGEGDEDVVEYMNSVLECLTKAILEAQQERAKKIPLKKSANNTQLS